MGSMVTGAVPLVRFTLRRERLRVAVWIFSIVLLVITTVASTKGLYPTQADLDRAAASENTAAAIIFNGPAQGLNNLGGQVAFQTGTFGLILMGLMSLFMLGRLTRGEEEGGHSELLRALPVGPHAPAMAAVSSVAAMNVVTGLLVASSLMALGLPATGSAVFGLSFTSFGLLITAVTLAAAQVTENTRVVYAIVGVVIGAGFVLRAVGDIGSGAISWLSPIGWAQKTRPFAGETWWPFLLLLAASLVVAIAAGVVEQRRDLGSGLIAPRPGPSRAAPSLSTAAGLSMRLQRGGLVGWASGVAILAAAYGSMTSLINDFVKDNDALAKLVAAQGKGTIVEQYIAMSFRILALIAAGYAIQSVLRTRSEETSARVDQVLATPISRVRWSAGHLVMAFGGTVAVLVMAGVAFGLADAVVTGNFETLPEALVGSLIFVPAIWALVGLAAALVGLTPRLSGLIWASLAVCFVIGMFGALLDLPSGVQNLSPFQHVPRYPAARVAVPPLAMLAAIAGGLTSLGLMGWRRRDIG